MGSLEFKTILAINIKQQHLQQHEEKEQEKIITAYVGQALYSHSPREDRAGSTPAREASLPIQERNEVGRS